MVISTYQVNNVLRVYGDQLRQNRVSSRARLIDNPSPDKVDISTGAKRTAVIERIASNIVDRIIQFGPNDKMEEQVFRKLEDEYGAQLAISKKGTEDLLFKVIDENGEMIHSLSIEDSRFLTHKLMAITKDAVGRNMM